MVRRGSAATSSRAESRASVVLNDMQTYFQKKNGNLNAKDKALMKAMEVAQSQGIGLDETVMGASICGFNGADNKNPFVVNNMPVEVRNLFLLKMFATLLVQIWCIIGFSAIFNYTEVSKTAPYVYGTEPLAAVTISLLVCILGLTLLFVFRHRSPYRLYAFAMFTFLFAHSCNLITVMAFTAEFEAMNRLLLLYSQATIALLIVARLSTSSIQFCQKARKRPSIGESLPPFMLYGILGWLLSLLPTVLVCVLFPAQIPVGSAAVISTMSIILVAWVGYDTRWLCTKLSANEHVSAVIFLYTDFFLMIFVSFLIMFFMILGDTGLANGTTITKNNRSTIYPEQQLSKASKLSIHQSQSVSALQSGRVNSEQSYHGDSPPLLASQLSGGGASNTKLEVHKLPVE